MDGNQSWYFRKQACSYCIKNIPMEISWFFVICDKFWPCFETVRFWKAISHRHNWLETKIMGNITSNQRENKTVDRISLLNLSWYQRNYSIFVTFRNSVAVRVYQNDVDLLFFPAILRYEGLSHRIRSDNFFSLCFLKRKKLYVPNSLNAVFHSSSVKENWLTF